MRTGGAARARRPAEQAARRCAGALLAFAAAAALAAVRASADAPAALPRPVSGACEGLGLAGGNATTRRPGCAPHCMCAALGALAAAVPGARRLQWAQYAAAAAAAAGGAPPCGFCAWRGVRCCPPGMAAAAQCAAGAIIALDLGSSLVGSGGDAGGALRALAALHACGLATLSVDAGAGAAGAQHTFLSFQGSRLHSTVLQGGMLLNGSLPPSWMQLVGQQQEVLQLGGGVELSLPPRQQEQQPQPRQHQERQPQQQRRQQQQPLPPPPQQQWRRQQHRRLQHVPRGARRWRGPLPADRCDRSALAATQRSPIVTAAECPGVEAGTCTRECQLRLCSALADLYRISNNASDPWDNEAGWRATAATPCEHLVAGGSAAPVYCSFYGVRCCGAGDVAAGSCTVLGTVTALELNLNNLNASVSDPGLLSALTTLHDCGMIIFEAEANNFAGAMSDAWGHLRHLTVLNLGNQWLEGTVPDLRRMRNLTLLNLSFNWLNGTLPAWLPELHELRVLKLGSQSGGNAGSNNTGLLGQMPLRLGSMHHLRELSLEGNSLTGALPHDLCSGVDSPLLLLNVRANRLNGSAHFVEACGNLVQLDLSENLLTGSPPASVDWDELATYRVGSNLFTGTLPPLWIGARLLEHLDVSSNKLTGTIPQQIALLSSLKSLAASSNALSGTITEYMFYLPLLSRLDLRDNRFVGTLPQSIGLALSLQELDISHNPGITGSLPAVMGLLKALRELAATNTSLSCIGVTKPFTVATNNSCTDPSRCNTVKLIGGNTTTSKPCATEQLLPCFLRFSDFVVPREDSSSMKCRSIVRQPLDTARALCSTPEADGGLGGQAPLLGEMRSQRMQAWLVEPSYYQYRSCECLQGFTPQWRNNGTAMQCLPDAQAQSSKHLAIIAGVIAAVAVLVAGAVLFVHYRTTRPAWMRERVMQAKRAKGPPMASKPGEKVRASIVVTDVKDFAELTRRQPELLSRAVAGHNNILRKACHTHAGSVLEQEGDSWTIAFHTAQDACAFSLQIQQALARKAWCMKSSAADEDLAALADMRSSTHFSMALRPSFNGSIVPGSAPSLDSSTASLVGGSASASPLGTPQGTPQGLDGGRRGGSAGGRLQQFSQSFSHGSADTSRHSDSVQEISCRLPDGWLHEGSGSSSRRGVSISHSHGNCDSQLLQLRNMFAQEEAEVQLAGSNWPGQGGTLASRANRSASQCDLGASVHAGSHGDMANGDSLDQRAGREDSSLWGRSANSKLGPRHRTSSGHSGHSSSLGRRTRRLSKLGLLDAADGHAQPSTQLLQLEVRVGIASGLLTYGCDVALSDIRARAKEQVCEAANGGQILLDESTFKEVKDSLSVLGAVSESGYDDQLLQRRLHAQAVSRLQRRFCLGLRPLRRASPGSGPEEPATDYNQDAIVVHMGTFELPEPETRHANSRAGSCATTASRPQQLQLYAIAAPGMRVHQSHARNLAHSLAWAEPVRIQPGWVRLAGSYFDAPGASAMELAPVKQGSRAQPMRLLLPEVTIVFAQVAAAPGQRRSRADTVLMSKAIRRCMLELLDEVDGGGYLCRCQEGELKYMVAFAAPHRAAQWALLLQEALMYVAWPAHILRQPGWEEVLDPELGLPLWRGPRVAMGLAEGRPNSVLPDHFGRTNYFGPSVNRAARFMSAAAQGGQLVTDQDTARKLLRLWAMQAILDGSGGGSCTAAQPAAGAAAAAAATTSAAPAAPTAPTAATAVAAAGAQQQPGQPPEAASLLLLLGSSATGSWSSGTASMREAAPDASAGRRPQPGGSPLRRGGNSPLRQAGSPVHPSGSSSLQRTTSDSSAEHESITISLPQPLAMPAAAAAPAPPSGGGGAGLTRRPSTGALTAGSRRPSLSLDVAARAASFTLQLPANWQSLAATSPPAPEAVHGMHVGTFEFKGSGTYEMVHLQQAGLAKRCFGPELPRGKGARVAPASGASIGLEPAALQLPRRLVVARQAFRARASR